MSDAVVPTDLAQQLGQILGGACGAIAARMSRPRYPWDRTAFPLLMLLWKQLNRTIARFASVVRRAGVGTKPRSRAATTRSAATDAKPRCRRNWKWLYPLVPEAAAYGSQLQHLLADPRMVALLAAAPQAGRILRPLCRMLGANPGPALSSPPLRRPPPPGPQAGPVAQTAGPSAVPECRDGQAEGGSFLPHAVIPG